jgi:FkbM family methyltransferase
MLVAILTMVETPYLKPCIEGVKDHDILIIKNGPVHIPEVEGASPVIYDSGENLGCAASWNYACEYAWKNEYPGVLILNDDVIIKGPIDELEEFDPDTFWRLHGYSAFYMTKNVWEKVGRFDEGFWPIYFEDCDYGHRMNLAGVAQSNLDQTENAIPYSHGHIDWEPGLNPYAMGGASNSIKYSQDLKTIHNTTGTLNKRRYITKWGGEPGYETLTVPEYVVPTKELYKGVHIHYNTLTITLVDNKLVRFGSGWDEIECGIAYELFRPDMRILVAGAGSGAASIALGWKFGFQNIYSFEGSKENCQHLRDHILFNFHNRGWQQFWVEEAAVWNKTGQVSWKPSPGASHPSVQETGEKIKSIDINEIIDRYQINALHLDIEGGEFSVIPHTNFENIRAVVLEIHPGEGSLDLEKTLEDNGMVIAMRGHYEQNYVVGAIRPELFEYVKPLAAQVNQEEEIERLIEQGEIAPFVPMG